MAEYTFASDTIQFIEQHAIEQLFDTVSLFPNNTTCTVCQMKMHSQAEILSAIFESEVASVFPNLLPQFGAIVRDICNQCSAHYIDNELNMVHELMNTHRVLFTMENTNAFAYVPIMQYSNRLDYVRIVRVKYGSHIIGISDELSDTTWYALQQNYHLLPHFKYDNAQMAEQMIARGDYVLFDDTIF